MKRPASVYILEILLFFLLIAGAFFMLAPVSGKLDSVLTDAQLLLFEKIEKETGLAVSWSSLSPSILKSLTVRDLDIRDASNGTVLAQIAEVSVSYNFREILKGNIAASIREIDIKNGNLTLDRDANIAVFRRLSSLVETGQAASGKKGKSAKSFGSPSVKIRLKNISVSYRQGGIKVAGSVTDGLADLDSQQIAFSVAGDVRVDHPLSSFSSSTAAKVELGGYIGRTFRSGSVSLTIKSLVSGPVSVDRLGLVTSFKNHIVSVSSVGSLQPVDINAVFNLDDSTFNGSLECEKLLPFKWIRIRNSGKKIPQGLSDVQLSGSARFSGGKGLLPEYSADFRVQVPDSILGGGEVRLSCTGDSRSIEIGNVSVTGPRYDASYTGSVSLADFVPEGFLDAKKIEIRDGCTVSGEMYLQREQKGFVCLVPQLTINSNVLNSVEIEVVPGSSRTAFNLSAWDDMGHISLDGDYTPEDGGFLQCYAAFDSISVKNTFGIASSIAAPDKNLAAIGEKLDPFALTTEIYVSTDFHDISFNCTRLVLASAEKDGLFLLLTAKGNKNAIELTDISFSRNGYTVTGNVTANFPSSGGVLFDSSLMVNTIPYAVSGSYGSDVLNLSGDYGLAATAVFGRNGEVSGAVAVRGLPVPVSGILVSLSLDTGFEFNSASDWRISITEGSVEEMGHLLPLDTLVSFGGMAGPAGVSLKRLTVSDKASTVSGFASISFGKDRSIALDASLASSESGESASVSGTLAPGKNPQFDAKISMKKVPLMRYIPGLPRSSVASLSVSASGTPQNPECTADISDLVFRVGDFDLEGRGHATLSGDEIHLSDASLSWNGQKFTKTSASVSLETFNANVRTDYSSVVGKSELNSRIYLSFSPEDTVPGMSKIADIRTLMRRFTLSMTVSNATWQNFLQQEPLSVKFNHEPGVTSISGGKNGAINGSLRDDGTFSLQSGETLPVSFSADGKITGSTLSVSVNDLKTDLAVLWPYLGIRYVNFPEGQLAGNFTVSGLVNDPDFHGKIAGKNITVNSPDTLGETYGPVNIEILAEGKQLTVPEFVVSGKSGSIQASAIVEFDRWIPSSLDVHAVTLAGRPVKLQAKNPLFEASGNASFDIDLKILQDIIEIDGSAEFEKGAFAVLLSGLSSQGKNLDSVTQNVKLNLALHVGKKVEFRWPSYEIPIIRGLVQADDPVIINLDTSINTFDVKGSANLRGGEIFYLKRSFYLRKGVITFNGNQDMMDPVITVLAEIRERDEDGEPVRIILSVDNQPLSSFKPVLYADPPKSETELMVLLGQATSADASRDTLLKDTVVTASDVITQMSVFRNVENSIRDFVGLDIFSVRTLILQNAVLGQSMQSATGEKEMTIGNYFDNTTVYMGKYLGAAIYADALMHFSYYDPLTTQNTGNLQAVYKNLLFQPEIGLEVTTPLFLFRWSLTPAHPDTLFVADNSLTLSWKFSY